MSLPMKDPAFTGFIDLAKLGSALHTLCPRSRCIGDACDGISRVTSEGLLHDCAGCGIKGKLLLPMEHGIESDANDSNRHQLREPKVSR